MLRLLSNTLFVAQRFHLVARSRQANVIDCGSTAYSIFLPEERPNTYRY
jgi:hypothetical protein